MPFKSKQQAKLFYAAAKKSGGIKGLTQETAKEFIKDTKHQKISNLPKYKRLKKAMGKKD